MICGGFNWSVGNNKMKSDNRGNEMQETVSNIGIIRSDYFSFYKTLTNIGTYCEIM
jgi:hypothetical protein